MEICTLNFDSWRFQNHLEFCYQNSSIQKIGAFIMIIKPIGLARLFGTVTVSQSEYYTFCRLWSEIAFFKRVWQIVKGLSRP